MPLLDSQAPGIGRASSASPRSWALGPLRLQAQRPRPAAPGAGHMSETLREPSLADMNANLALFAADPTADGWRRRRWLFKSISFSVLRRSFSRLSPRSSPAIWKGFRSGAAPAASALLTQSDMLPASQHSSRASSAYVHPRSR